MTLARENLISLDDTPYYHCMARCVRRAFLFGEDSVTGKRYDHRKQWIVDRITALSSVFCIDVCAYAVMSNHYHLVLRVDIEMIDTLSNQAIMERWTQLFTAPVLIERYLDDDLTMPEIRVAEGIIAKWRTRLGDISWFMRCLNEKIARMANEEEGCKGRFWEGRFKSQALLDETAVLACMAYVDLNPIRAGMVKTLQDSDYTSIQQRIQALANRKVGRPSRSNQAESGKGITSQPPATSIKANTNPNTNPIPNDTNPIIWPTAMAELSIKESDYLDLVDWTGRMLRDDKKGAISNQVPDLLSTLPIDPNQWLSYVPEIEDSFSDAIGAMDKLKALGEKLGKSWLHGQRIARQFYKPPDLGTTVRI